MCTRFLFNLVITRIWTYMHVLCHVYERVRSHVNAHAQQQYQQRFNPEFKCRNFIQKQIPMHPLGKPCIPIHKFQYKLNRFTATHCFKISYCTTLQIFEYTKIPIHSLFWIPTHSVWTRSHFIYVMSRICTCIHASRIWMIIPAATETCIIWIPLHSFRIRWFIHMCDMTHPHGWVISHK